MTRIQKAFDNQKAFIAFVTGGDPDVETTKKPLKNYLAAFPKVSGYMDKTIADARACGYVSTLFGRRRALPGDREEWIAHLV